MTNSQIIAGIATEIYGEDAVEEMMEQGKEIPLHTLKGWSVRGYAVKKDEHGIETRLWKKRKNKVPNEDNEAGDVPADRDFYLCKSYLFGANQVERKE